MNFVANRAERPTFSTAATARRPKLSPIYGPKTSTLSQNELQQIVAAVIG